LQFGIVAVLAYVFSLPQTVCGRSLSLHPRNKQGYTSKRRPNVASIKLLACYSGFELSHQLQRSRVQFRPGASRVFLRAMRTGHPLDLSEKLEDCNYSYNPSYNPKCFPCGVMGGTLGPKKVQEAYKRTGPEGGECNKQG
jgi:hypothetical protein